MSVSNGLDVAYMGAIQCEYCICPIGFLGWEGVVSRRSLVGAVPEKEVITDHLEETCVLLCKGTAGGRGIVVSTEKFTKASPSEKGATFVLFSPTGTMENEARSW